MAARDDIAVLLEDLEPQAAAALNAAIRDVVDETVLSGIVERLEAGDVEGAVALVDAPSAVFNAFAVLVGSFAFGLGGTAVMNSLPRMTTSAGLRLVPRFDVRSPRSRTWIDREEARIAGHLSRETSEVLRGTFTRGLQAGRRPSALVLDAVGRVNRAGARRVGGVIGLTPQLSEFVDSARLELQSGDPALLRNYLDRRLRDPRFDKQVRQASVTGEPLPAAEVDRLTTQYAIRLLNLRVETLARTELRGSLHAGQAEAMRQVVQTGAATPEMVLKTWRHSRLPNVRESHLALDGQSVQADMPFVTPRGSKMMHPCDRSLGAASSDVAGCRCHAVYRLRYRTATGSVGSRRVG